MHSRALAFARLPLQALMVRLGPLLRETPQDQGRGADSGLCFRGTYLPHCCPFLGSWSGTLPLLHLFPWLLLSLSALLCPSLTHALVS